MSARVAAALILQIGHIGHTMYKLAIGNIIIFPVAIAVVDGDSERTFSFKLTAARPEESEIRALYEQEGHKKVSEFHAARCRQWITGWTGQGLVLDAETGQPAAFSAEALDCVLAVPGAATVIFNAHMEAVTATAGAQGRAKN